MTSQNRHYSENSHQKLQKPQPHRQTSRNQPQMHQISQSPRVRPLRTRAWIWTSLHRSITACGPIPSSRSGLTCPNHTPCRSCSGSGSRSRARSRTRRHSSRSTRDFLFSHSCARTRARTLTPSHSNRNTSILTQSLRELDRLLKIFFRATGFHNW